MDNVISLISGRIIIIFLSLVFLINPLKAQEINVQSDQFWKAGVARTIITPPEYMWMAGYAARERPAEGKIHDLWAKALALEDAREKRVLLITSDIIGFSRDLSVSICSRLGEKYNLERKDIILSSSHTHSGPVMNDNLFGIYPAFDDKLRKQVADYSKFIEEQIVILAGRAINSLAPVHLYTGVGIARFAVNRRASGWEGDILYDPDVEGPSDHVVQTFTVQDLNKKPIVIVFGYSCHATSLSGYEWSGDYPGFAQIELEKTYPGLTAMFYAGFGADQNPFPRGGVLECEQYGKELAIAVEKVMKDSMEALSPSLQTVYNEIELEIEPPPDSEELDEVMDKGANWEKNWAKTIKKKLAAGEELPGTYPHYPIQSWQLGKQTLVVMGGEVVVDYVFKFREKLGNDLYIMGYANDVMAYIPSERVLKEGGYEGKTSMWVYGHRGNWIPGIEEKIFNEVVRQVSLLRGEADSE
jgi:hypothetical protein